MSKLLEIVKKAIDEKKGERTILYEFSSLNPFIEHVVITSASNIRQVYAIADNIADRMKEQEFPIKNIEGDRNSRWVLVDLYDVIVHVFLNEERDHFQLEKLYADLPFEDFTI